MCFQCFAFPTVPGKCLKFQVKVTCHGRGRKFESRRSRHSLQVLWNESLWALGFKIRPLHTLVSASVFYNICGTQTVRVHADSGCAFETRFAEPSRELPQAERRIDRTRQGRFRARWQTSARAAMDAAKSKTQDRSLMREPPSIGSPRSAAAKFLRSS